MTDCIYPQLATHNAHTMAAVLHMGPIVRLVTEPDARERYVLERHVCVDTTAAGGNASLLAEAEA